MKKVEGKKVWVFLPAYNARETLKKTYQNIPRDLVHEILLVDDASQDGTPELARSLSIRTVVHERNLGYGANQKTGFRIALKEGADIIVLLHPDYQYDPQMIPELIGSILEDKADVVLCSRMRGREALRRGMPYYKFIGNIFLTRVENFFLGTSFSELHTGLRAYSRVALEAIPLEKNSDDFVFDSEMVVELLTRGFRFAEIYSPARYLPDSSSIGFFRSVVYGVETLLVLFKYFFHRIGLVKDERFG
ncbi:MAG: glycosyltransferase family 2 protein [Proteobacteria bacterium]|nr:glycosyltransferase family 2 protein [Pseudomonadota bacterium]